MGPAIEPRDLPHHLSLPVVAAWLLVVAFGGVAHSADGDLDATFGADGKVTTSFTTAGGANAVAVQSDGKIVAAGWVGGGFGLARYNADGALDTTFGPGGTVTTAISQDGGDEVRGLALQPDGKIVAAGTAGRLSFALARYNSDGTLDATFGTGGIVTTDLTSGFDIANGVVIQANGKIVAGGSAGTSHPAFALARYEPDGTPDTSFGEGGTVTTGFGIWGVARAIVLQPDRKIVAAGTNGGGFALARYDPDGSLDTSFGNGGKVATTLTVAGSAWAVALQLDGKIVAAGAYDFYRFAVARFGVHGRLDRTFGGDGLVTTDVGRGSEQKVNGLVIQPNGKIVAVGDEGPHEFGEPLSRIVLTRYRANGVLDPRFDGDGKVITRFKDGAFAAGVARQDGGRIVVAGRAGESFALARYLV